MNSKRIIFRAWMYFRFGYSTYVAAAISLANLLGIVYLMLKTSSSFSVVADSSLMFLGFTAILVLVISVVNVMFGYLHFRKLPAYGADAEISIESNPYTYRLQPGYWRETFFPTMQLIAQQIRLMSKKTDNLSFEAEQKFQKLDDDFNWLIGGGNIGNPSDLGRRITVARREGTGNGNLKLGKNVSFGDNVHIDTTRSVTIEDKATITDKRVVRELGNGP